ncbi:hypothetical protein ACWJJH_06785 [Endozoicomonadaceae bacterium StTr2]
MNKLSLSSVLLVLFLLGATPVPAAEMAQLPLLFCVYDMGETNAFKPLWKLLDKEAIDYRILAVDAAAGRLQGNDKVIAIKTDARPDSDWHTQRSARINSDTLAELARQRQVRLVISGMASGAQAEVLNYFREKQKSYTIAYYDNLDSVEHKPFVQAFLGKARQIDRFWVPAGIVRDDMGRHLEIDPSVIEIVGQPSLESWDRTYRQFSANALKQELGISADKKVAVFAGGYDSTYPEYLDLFINTMKQHPEWETLITWHPKTDGSLEKQLVARAGSKSIRAIPSSVHNTAELSVAADLVAVHKSTVAIQAAYKGKPVVYVAESDHSTPLIQYQIAPLASSQNELEQVLRSADSDSASARFSKLGLPGDGSALMLNLIRQQLQ